MAIALSPMPRKSDRRENREEEGRCVVYGKAVPVGAVHVTWLVIITVNEYNRQAK